MTYNQNPFGGYPFVGPEPDKGPDDVPDGSTKEILAWVGDSEERAAKALAAEKSRDKPRSTLVKALGEG